MDPSVRLARTMVVGATALLALLFASQMYLWINWWPMRIGWLLALAWSLPQLVVWLSLSPIAVSLSRRYPIDRGSRGVRILGHVLAGIGFGLTGLLFLDFSDRILHWSTSIGAPELVSRLKYTFIHLHWGTVIYWVVLGADHAVRYHRETRERDLRAANLETALSRSQLSMLRAQLNPHFLFNTLNSIAVLLRRDPARAEDMVHRLGDFLRASLDGDEGQLSTLAAELARLRDYIDIEWQRFHDRLTVRFDVEPDTREALVPVFLLQPLVENAIRHGVAPRPGPVTVGVVAQRVGDRLRLVIRDDGAGLREPVTEGTGLTNTRRRLDVLYGKGAQMRLTNRAEGGTEAVVEIPWQPADIPA
jgi:two-component sensor histidine kinase